MQKHSVPRYRISARTLTISRGVLMIMVFPSPYAHEYSAERAEMPSLQIPRFRRKGTQSRFLRSPRSPHPASPDRTSEAVGHVSPPSERVCTRPTLVTFVVIVPGALQAAPLSVERANATPGYKYHAAIHAPWLLAATNGARSKSLSVNASVLIGAGPMIGTPNWALTDRDDIGTVATNAKPMSRCRFIVLPRQTTPTRSSNLSTRPTAVQYAHPGRSASSE